MSTTVNRRMIKNRILAGRVIVMCNYRYTDDYQYDVCNDHGRTGWMPARIGGDAFVEGTIRFSEDSFRGYGRAYISDKDVDGVDLITFVVHSNLVYTMKILPESDSN